MDTSGSFWTKARAGRYGRRSAIRGAVVAGAGVASVGLAACKVNSGKTGGAAPAAQPAVDLPKQGGTFNTALDKGPDTFDPHRSVASQTANFLSYMGSRLFRFRTSRDAKAKEDSDLESDLALTAESPDAVTWTFKLRPDAKFHNTAPVNGHAVDAEDVKATFTRALAPEGAGRASLNMIDPTQIQTPDRTTVVFKLKYPYADFRAQMASFKFSWILPREALAGAYDPAKLPIGSGPFMLENFTPDVAVTFKKNPDYFEKGLPYLDHVRAAIIPDRGAPTVAQFQGNNLEDIRPNINDVDTVKRTVPKAAQLNYLSSHPLLGFFPLGDPTGPFTDVRVRRAVSMAVDRDALIAAIWGGNANIEYVVPLNMGRWSLRPNEVDASVQQYYKFNLPEAKKMIEAAGGANLNVKLAFYLPDTDTKIKTAQTIYNMLKALPWNISLVQQDYLKDWLGSGKGVRYGALAKDTIAFTSTDGLATVDDFVYGYFHSSSPTNVDRVKDSQLDGLLDKARGIVNDDERLKAYKDVQKYVVDKVYELDGIPSGPLANFVQPWVHGYYMNGIEDFGRMACSGVWLTK